MQPQPIQQPGSETKQPQPITQPQNPTLQQSQIQPIIQQQSLAQSNISNLMSVSQTSSLCQQKEQKQSSNDGLNSDRSYPSSLYDKDKLNERNDRQQKSLKRKRRSVRRSQQGQLNQSQTTENQQTYFDEDNISEDSRLKYDLSSDPNKTATLTFMKLIFMICKKEYAFEVIRIMMYAFISITVFAYVLDQNKQKKQFYQAFYSSEQITISKEINGVFPPLFGSQNDIINRTWILETYNSHLMVEDEENNEMKRDQLIFEFTPYNILYIKTNSETCVQQLKFRWKMFDYNMRIYEVVESDFEKIEDQNVGCFPNKKQIQQKMKEVSLWTIDWQSKQLYLLSEPFRDDIKEGEEGTNRFERWNELIVLKKHSANSV